MAAYTVVGSPLVDRSYLEACPNLQLAVVAARDLVRRTEDLGSDFDLPPDPGSLVAVLVSNLVRHPRYLEAGIQAVLHIPDDQKTRLF